jgi:hypothetical protein
MSLHSVPGAPYVRNPKKPKCALCGVNLTSLEGVNRAEHESGAR